ncbi:MAG: hypothetical protein AAFZ58_07240 [Pseudomonadota bacterium]
MLEKIGYLCLALAAGVYLLLALTGIIIAGPLGWLYLLIFVGFGALFIKVLAERLGNKEDDHYSKNVER